MLAIILLVVQHQVFNPHYQAIMPNRKYFIISGSNHSSLDTLICICADTLILLEITEEKSYQIRV